MQILSGLRLPDNFTPKDIKEQYNEDEDTDSGNISSGDIKSLLAGCFKDPTKRPSAQKLHQRLLDKYNEEYAKEQQLHLDVLKLLETGHKIIYSQRETGGKRALAVIPLSSTDIATLLKFASRDKGSKLQLAPKVNFTLGAGIFWDIIDPDLVNLSRDIVSPRLPSPTGTNGHTCSADNLAYKYKVAIHYLTRSIDLGYDDARHELKDAHLLLSKYYATIGEGPGRSQLELPN